MNRPVISIDIDDVLAESAKAFVAFSNKHWGTQLEVDDYDDDWAKMWQMDHEHDGKEIGHRADLYHQSIIHHTSINAHDALRALKKDYDLILVTARQTNTKGDTLLWIQREFPGIFEENKIYFAGMWDKITPDSVKKTKGELLKQLGSSFHIDDQPKHCVGALEQDIQPLLFGDYGWNKSCEMPDGVVRVKDWAEILEYFNNRKKSSVSR